MAFVRPRDTTVPKVEEASGTCITNSTSYQHTLIYVFFDPICITLVAFARLLRLGPLISEKMSEILPKAVVTAAVYVPFTISHHDLQYRHACRPEFISPS